MEFAVNVEGQIRKALLAQLRDFFPEGSGEAMEAEAETIDMNDNFRVYGFVNLVTIGKLHPLTASTLVRRIHNIHDMANCLRQLNAAP